MLIQVLSDYYTKDQIDYIIEHLQGEQPLNQTNDQYPLSGQLDFSQGLFDVFTRNLNEGSSDYAVANKKYVNDQINAIVPQEGQSLNQINTLNPLTGNLDISQSIYNLILKTTDEFGPITQPVNLEYLNTEIQKINDNFYPNTTALNSIQQPNNVLTMANFQIQDLGYPVLTTDAANSQYVIDKIEEIPIYIPEALNLQNNAYPMTGDLNFDNNYQVLIRNLDVDSTLKSAINNGDVLIKIGDLKEYVDGRSISDFLPANEDVSMNGFNLTELPPYVNDIKNLYNACSIKHLNDSLDGLVQVFMQKGLSLTQINEANPQVVDLTLQSELGSQALLINTFEVDDPKLPPLQNKYCAVNIEAIHKCEVGFLSAIAPIDFSEVTDFYTRVIENPPTGFFDKRVANMGALTNYLPSAIAASTYLNFNQDNFNTIINPPIDAVSFGNQCIRFIKEDDEIQNPTGWLTSAVTNAQLLNRLPADYSLGQISIQNPTTIPVDMNGWSIENCIESFDSNAVTINAQLANYQQIKSLGYISQHVENDMDLQCNNLPITGLPSNLDINRGYAAQWGSVLDKIAAIEPPSQKSINEISLTNPTNNNWDNAGFKIQDIGDTDPNLTDLNDAVNVNVLKNYAMDKTIAVNLIDPPNDNFDMNTHKIINCANADLLQPNDVVNVQVLNNVTGQFIDSFVPLDSDILMNNHTISGLPSILPLSLYQTEPVTGGDLYSVLSTLVDTFINSATSLDQIKKCENNLDINQHEIINILDGTTDQSVTSKKQVETYLLNYLPTSTKLNNLITNANVDFSGFELLNVQYPNQFTSAANMQYVQDYVSQHQGGNKTLQEINFDNPQTVNLDFTLNGGVMVPYQSGNLLWNEFSVCNVTDIDSKDAAILGLAKTYSDNAVYPSISTYQAKVMTNGQNIVISNLNANNTKGCSISIPQYTDQTSSITLGFDSGTISSGSLKHAVNKYPLLSLMSKANRALIFPDCQFVDDQISNITLSSLGLPTTDISMNTHKITNLSDGTLTTDAISLGQANGLYSTQTQNDARYYQNTVKLNNMSLANGSLDVNSNKIVNLSTCTNGNDAANKSYVDLPHLSIQNTSACSVNCSTANSINLTANGTPLLTIAQAVGQAGTPTLFNCPNKLQIQTSLNAVSLNGDQVQNALGTTNTMSLYVQQNNNNPLYNNQCQIVCGDGTILPAFTMSSGHIDLGAGQQTFMQLSNNGTMQSTCLLLSPGYIITDNTLSMFPNALAVAYPIQNQFSKRTGLTTEITPINSSSLEFAQVKYVTDKNNAQSLSNLATLSTSSINCNSQHLINLPTANSSQISYATSVQSVLNFIQTYQNQSYFTVNIATSSGVPLTLGAASLASLYYTTTSPSVWGTSILGVSSTQLYPAYSTEIIVNIQNNTVNFQNLYDISATIQSNATTQAQKLNDSRVFVSCVTFLSSSQISILLSQFQAGASAVFVQLQFRRKQY